MTRTRWQSLLGLICLVAVMVPCFAAEKKGSGVSGSVKGNDAVEGDAPKEDESDTPDEADGCRRAIELTVKAVKISEPAEEERLYNEALTSCPTLPEARYNRALLYRRQGKRELALVDLGKALEMRDDDRFRVARARILGELQQYDGARVDYRAVLNRNRSDSGALIGMAALAQKQGDKAEAIRLLEEGRVSDPTSALIRLNLGLLYELSGRIDEAAAEYTRASELDSLNGEAWFRRGGLLAARGESEKAISAFEKAIAAGGETEIAARVALARLYRGRKLTEKAQFTLRRGLDREPDNLELLRELAAVLFAEQRFEQVVEEAGKVIAREPQQAPLLLLKGAAERRLGRLEAAERSLRESLAIDDQNAAIHYELALLFRALGRSDESSRHARLSKELAKDGEDRKPLK